MGYFITQWALSCVQSLNSKGLEHLNMFPRKNTHHASANAINLPESYLRLQAEYSSETFPINHSYCDRFLYKVSSRNSKMSFSVTAEGGCVAVNYFHVLKVEGLNSNRLWGRTLLELLPTLLDLSTGKI